MNFKTIANFLGFSALLMVIALPRFYPAEQSGQAPAADAAASVQALRNELQELARRQQSTATRLADLEQVVTAGLGPLQTPGAEAQDADTDEVESGVAESPTLQSPRRSRNLELITEAGLSIEEYSAMEEQARALALAELDRQWSQRRERYLEGEREPGAAEQMREALGDSAYDRYLYASGRSNRVRINQVLPGSAAEQAGLLNGDIILSYGDKRVFNFSDLRRQSYEGELGEPTLLEVQRADGSIAQMILPRGPMGLSGYRGWREAPSD